MSNLKRTIMSATKKITKFEANLTLNHKSIIKKRAKMFTFDAKSDSEDYIRGLEKQRRDLERILISLEDLQVNSTTSLKVNPDGINSEYWVREMNKTTVAIGQVDIELDAARIIHKTWFE